MGLKERLQKRLEYEDKKERFLLRPFHSSFYHRQFEGYTEYRRPDAKGKRRVTRVYTGQYYRASVSDTRRIVLRAAYMALFILALVCFFRGTLLDIPANRSLPLNLVTAISVPALFWLGMGIVSYLFGKKLLTIPAYRSGPERLRKASLVSAVLFGVRVVTILIFCFGSQNGFGRGDIQVLLSAVLAGLCVLLINRLEAAVVYEDVENPVKPESDGIEIR